MRCRRVPPALVLLVVLVRPGGGLAAGAPVDPGPLKAAFDASYRAGHYADAADLARRRVTRLEADPASDPDTLASALLDLGRVLPETNAFDEAVRSLRSALDLRRDLHGPDDPTVAEVLGELGFRSASAAGRAAGGGDADSLLQEALRIQVAALGPDAPEVGRTLRRLAMLRWGQTRIAEAESLSARALDLSLEQRGEQDLGTAEALMTRYWIRDRYRNEALQYVIRALVIRRAILGSDHPLVAESLLWLGMSRYRQGDPVAAESLLREALEMRRRFYGDTHDAMLESWGNLALVLESLGRHDEAVEANREAIRIGLELAGPENVNTDLLAVYSNLAVTYIQSGRAAEGLQTTTDALEMARRAGLAEDHGACLQLRFNRAAALQRVGRAEDAVAEWESLRRDDRRVLGEASTLTIDLSLGHLAYRQGDLSGAIHHMQRATRAFELQRAQAVTGVVRSVQISDSPYAYLAALYAENGQPVPAWDAVERSRSRGLAEMLRTLDRQNLSQAESARRDSLRRDLIAALDMVWRARREGVGIEPAEDRLLVAEAAVEGCERELEASHPGQGFVSSLADAQSLLDGHTAIFGWAITGFGAPPRAVVWTYLIRSTGDIEWRRVGEGDAAQDLIDRLDAFKTRLAGQASPLGAGSDPGLEEEARELGTAFFGPLLACREGIERVVVIPALATSGVPLEALRDPEGGLLGDRFVMSYAPSTSVLSWAVHRRHSRTEPSRIFALGDPAFRPESEVAMVAVSSRSGPEAAPDPAVVRDALSADPSAIARLPRLTWSRSEVEHVTRCFREAEVLLGSDASEVHLREMAAAGSLERFPVLHLATHALIDRNAPLSSALVLSQQGSDEAPDRVPLDGLLTGVEIAGSWKLDADLVVLSACETGMARWGTEGSTVGFAHAFFAAGARCLLVSLWKVDDEATALLMSRFYRNWTGVFPEDGEVRRAPMTRAAALQEAKHWLRTWTDEHGDRPFESPYYWSAFVLVGDAG